MTFFLFCFVAFLNAFVNFFSRQTADPGVWSDSVFKIRSDPDPVLKKFSDPVFNISLDSDPNTDSAQHQGLKSLKLTFSCSTVCPGSSDPS